MSSTWGPVVELTSSLLPRRLVQRGEPLDSTYPACVFSFNITHVPGLDLAQPQDMISLARDNAKKQGLKPPHVAFVQTSLADPLPIASNSIDCVLSNCVVNLLPKNGKESLIKEIYRVLKRGGRVIIDDVSFDFS